jgi:hypothetical protein
MHVPPLLAAEISIECGDLARSEMIACMLEQACLFSDSSGLVPQAVEHLHVTILGNISHVSDFASGPFITLWVGPRLDATANESLSRGHKDSQMRSTNQCTPIPGHQ